MRNKKWLALAMASVMSMSVLAGCQSDVKETTAAATTKAAAATKEAVATEAPKAEVTELTFVTNADSSNVLAGNNAELNQAAIDYVESELGIKLNVVSVPHESYQEKLNLMLNAGDEIDVFLVQSVKEYGSMNIRRGYAADITELVQSSDSLSRVNSDFYELLSSDGKIYGVPQLAPNDQIIYVRKDILDQYGVKIPTTTDELYTEFKKLADQGIIPLCMPKWMNNFQFYYNSFDAWRGLKPDANGKWVDGFNTPEMREALEYLHLLYTDGILDMEFITNENSTMREKFYGGSTASCLYWTTWYAEAMMEFDKMGVKPEIVAVPALAGPNGQKGGTLNQGVSDGYMVHAKSEKKEVAVKFLNWLTATPEGNLFCAAGVEGVHHTLNGSGELEMTQASTDAGFALGSNILLGTISPDSLDVKLTADMDAPMKENLEFVPEVYAQSGPLYDVPVGVCEAYDKIKASYQEKMNEFAANAILNGDIEGVMKDYESYWKSIDGDAILAELNK